MKTLFIKKEIRPVSMSGLTKIQAALSLQDFRPLSKNVVYSRIYAMLLKPEYGDIFRCFGFPEAMVPNEQYIYRVATLKDFEDLYMRTAYLKFLTENNPFTVLEKPRAMQADLIRSFRAMREAAMIIDAKKIETAYDTVANLAATYFFNYRLNPDISEECKALLAPIMYTQVAILGLNGVPYTDKHLMISSRLIEDVSIIAGLFSEEHFVSVGKETLSLTKEFNKGFSSTFFGNYLPDRAPYANVVHSNAYAGGIVKLSETGKFRSSIAAILDIFQGTEINLPNYILSTHAHSTQLSSDHFITRQQDVMPNILLTSFTYDQFVAACFDLLEFTTDQRAVSLAGYHAPSVFNLLMIANTSIDLIDKLNLTETINLILTKTDMLVDYTLILDRSLQETILDFYEVPDNTLELSVSVKPGESAIDMFTFISQYVTLSAPFNPLDSVFYPRSTFFDGDGFYEANGMFPFTDSLVKVDKIETNVKFYQEKVYSVIRDQNVVLRLAAKLTRILMVYQQLDEIGKEAIRLEMLGDLMMIGQTVIADSRYRQVFYGNLRNQKILASVEQVAYAIAWIKLLTDLSSPIFSDIKMMDIVRLTRL